MIRDIMVLFEYERKRRPELAALATHIDTLTEAEIRNADVPMPWMREALLQLKHQHDSNSLAEIIERTVVNGVNPDPTGVMRQWHGIETYIKIDRSSLLITPGTLVWLDSTGIWIDTIFSMYVDPRLASNTVARGSISRSAYYLAVREQARGARMPLSSSSSSQSSYYQEPIEQIRFFRPG